MTEGDFNKLAPGSVQKVRFRPNNSDSLAYFKEEGADKIYFYVNPSTVNYDFRKKITRQRSRAGWIDEYWGDELDTLTVDAVTGGIYTDTEGYAPFNDEVFRKKSDAFNRLEQIVQLYRGNGLKFDSNFPSDFRPLQFGFDKFIYYGYFESFTLNDNVDRPFMLAFNFIFKVLKTELLF